MPKKTALPSAVARPVKRRAGPTPAATTPLNLRASGVRVDAATERHVRDRAGRKLKSFIRNVERVTARFEDVNGPKGGVDTVCRLKIVLSGLASVIVEERATTPLEAFDRAIDRAQRVVKRDLDKAGRRSPRAATRPPRAPPRAANAARAPNPPPEAGSLIGRRVGRARANLRRAAARPEKLRRDVAVDTAAPGQSASDRRAGAGSTAARNTKLRDSGATSALEDSAQDRPSRKSTRRSNNRSTRDSNLRRRAVRAESAPSARAAKRKVAR